MIRPRRRRPSLAPRRFGAEPLEGRAYFVAGLTFSAPVSYDAGSNPAAIATADFNGDGLPDVVVANYGVNNNSVSNGGISVLLHTPTASFSDTNAFQPATFYSVKTQMQDIAVADLNGDGRPDVVAVGSSSPYVYVWLNTGIDGQLAAPVSYPVGPHPEGVAIADVNQDGHLDIVTANQGDSGKNSISVLLGNGNGTFGAATGYNGGPNPDALAVGDLNQDGFPDIVTVDPANDEIHVLLNRGAKAVDGAGQFPTTNTEYGTDITGRAITIVDINNDARPDLAIANLRAATVGTLLNYGDGTFHDSATYRVGGFPFSIVSADLNDDNRAELITADSRDNAVGVLVHNTRAGFNTGGGTGAANDHTNNPRQFVTGTAPEGVAVADIDGDGRPDLITADFNDGQIAVLYNGTPRAKPPLISTTITVAASQSPVASGNKFALTAQVTPAPAPAYAAGRVVQFLSGTRVLGVGKLQADGTATIDARLTLPKDTTSADYPITVRFNGNGHYNPSEASITESVVSAAGAAPLVAATAVAVTSRAGRAGAGSTVMPAFGLPAAPTTLAAITAKGVFLAPSAVLLVAQSTTPFVAGDVGTVGVTITNSGTLRATGYVTVSLALVSVADPAVSIPLTTIGSATFGVDVRSGFANVVPVQFKLPTPLAAGSYNIAATLTRARATFATGEISTAPIATTTPSAIVSVLVPLTPGDTATTNVTITNQGSGPASGAVSVALSIAPASDPTAAVTVAVFGTDTFNVNLLGGHSRTVPVRFTVPASLAAGDYTVLATLTPAGTFAADQVSAATAASTDVTTVIAAFGQVPSGRRAPSLTTALPDGTAATFTLTGPGVGTITETPVTVNGVTAYRTDVNLAGTSAATTFSIDTHGVATTINTFLDNSRLGSILAPDVTIAGNTAVGLPVGSLTLSTGVNQIVLAGMDNDGMLIGPRGHAALSLGTVTDLSLTTTSVIQSLAVNSWTNTLGYDVTMPGVLGAITSAGDFNANLIISGALPSISIGGTLGDAQVGSSWTIGTGVGTIRVGGDTNNIGILVGFRIAPATRTVPAHYVFNAARIAAVTIGGSVIDTFVGAGFRPLANAAPPFDPTGGATIPGGSIGAITVVGTVDATSQFLAASVPAIGR